MAGACDKTHVLRAKEQSFAPLEQQIRDGKYAVARRKGARLFLVLGTSTRPLKELTVK
jgi:hypothetical protein